LQKNDQNNLYSVVKNHIPPTVLANKNNKKSWQYGYDEKYDMIVISKNGTIGEVYNINGLLIALPKTPDAVYSRDKKKENQYWQPFEYPKELDKIKSIFHWHDMPNDFKSKWVDYIETEFDRRENGFFFMNNGVETYMTGSHYMYCQWTKIDVGLPDFREANRIFFIYWEACRADDRCFGMDVNTKHVVNVGLWTPGKNQGEMLELAKQMPDVVFHFVGNQAINFKHYWGPLVKDGVPDNVKIWGERDDVDMFLDAADVFMFNSTWECNPLVIREAISKGKKIIARNLPQYKNMFTRYIVNLDPRKLKNQLSDLIDDKTTYDILENNTTANFRNKLLSLYKSAIKFNIMKNDVKDYKITQHFVGQPFLEITGTSDSDFTVEFYDEEGNLFYRNTIKVNHWVRLSKEYFIKWTTKVYKDDELVYTNVLDYTDKRVYIAFDSSSLGDNIAWMPYVEEFRKKHNCKMIVSTFKNFLFDSKYPDIEFVDPGSVVPNLYGMYKIGWFYDFNKEPSLPNTIPLQMAATNILGLEYTEIRPDIVNSRTHLALKHVTIATNSTAGCKFWTREGWQEVINYLHGEGYLVINTSKESNPFNNCQPLVDTSMTSTMTSIYNSKFFIGLSSGLSWLAWALKTPVVMISNFTEEDHEFSCNRVTNTNVCHGCWNDPKHKFDKGDWNWCPNHKDTDRQFECHKEITPDMVITEIKKLLN